VVERATGALLAPSWKLWVESRMPSTSMNPTGETLSFVKNDVNPFCGAAGGGAGGAGGGDAGAGALGAGGSGSGAADGGWALAVVTQKRTGAATDAANVRWLIVSPRDRSWSGRIKTDDSKRAARAAAAARDQARSGR
jgi:hypothetical protein